MRLPIPSRGGDKGVGFPNEKDIDQIASELLPYGKAYEWNQALMDYAQAMLKNEKIPISRQSKFKDSDRYYRGAIIRFLLKHKTLSCKKIHTLFIDQKTKIEEDRLQKILSGLQKDQLIYQDGKDIFYL